MEGKQAETRTRTVTEQELAQLIRGIPLLARLEPDELSCLGAVELVEAPAGTSLYRAGSKPARILRGDRGRAAGDAQRSQRD